MSANAIQKKAYEDFLRGQGLSEDEIVVRVKERELFESQVLSRGNPHVDNIGDSGIQLKFPKFAKLKESFFPKIFNYFTKEVENGNSIIHKQVVVGMVTNDFLTSDKYKTLLGEIRDKAQTLGVEVTNNQKSLSDGKYENIFAVKGHPANVNNFFDDIKEIAKNQNLDIANLTESVKNNPEPVPTGDFEGENNNIQPGTLSSVNEDDDVANSSERKSVELEYSEKFGFIARSGVQIQYLNTYDNTRKTTFKRVFKDYEMVGKELANQMRVSEEIKKETLSGYASQEIMHFLKYAHAVKPDLVAEDVSKALKSRDTSGLPENIPEFTRLWNNRDAIVAHMEKVQNKIDKNHEKIVYLTNSLIAMKNLAETIPAKEAKFGFIVNGSYFKHKLQRKINEIELPTGETFKIASGRLKESKKDQELIMGEEDFTSLKKLVKAANQKAFAINEKKNEYLAFINKKSEEELRNDLDEFLNLKNDFLVAKSPNSSDEDKLKITPDKVKRLTELKHQFDDIALASFKFKEENYDDRQKLLEITTALHNLKKPLKPDMSKRMIRKNGEYNESLFVDLSPVMKKIMSNGIHLFEQDITSQVKEKTAVPLKEADVVMKESRNLDELLMNSDIWEQKSIIIQATNSNEAAYFAALYADTTNMIEGLTNKALGKPNGKENPQAPEEAEKLDKLIHSIELAVNDEKKIRDPKYLQRLHDNLEAEMNKNGGVSIEEVNKLEADVNRNLLKMQQMLSDNPGLQGVLRKIPSHVLDSVALLARSPTMITSIREQFDDHIEELPNIQPVKNQKLAKLRPLLKDKLHEANMKVIHDSEMHTVPRPPKVRPKTKKQLAEEAREQFITQSAPAIVTKATSDDFVPVSGASAPKKGFSRPTALSINNSLDAILGASQQEEADKKNKPSL